VKVLRYQDDPGFAEGRTGGGAATDPPDTSGVRVPFHPLLEAGTQSSPVARSIVVGVNCVYQKGNIMSGIVLSSAVRQNLLSLQSTADLLAQTQSRLSTGKSVNSALDNPSNFFTAQSLDNRASDINNLLDGIGNGVQVLQAANTGITSLQKLIDSAKSIANQALQTTVGLLHQVERRGNDCRRDLRRSARHHQFRQRERVRQRALYRCCRRHDRGDLGQDARRDAGPGDRSGGDRR
jgi:hypothetical protein